jgi:hypothetical protein
MLKTILAALLIPSVTLADTIPRFAENVVIHVLAHELGHALIREFDLPVLTNEEEIAETFGTLLVAEAFPDRAGEIILDRARSQRLEAEQDGLTDEAMMSEHPPDLRRAYRAICTLYGTDPERFANLPEQFGLSQDAADGCADSVPELMRGWRRVLASLRMPEGQLSNEVRVIYGEGPMNGAMQASGVMELIEATARRIDWHSQITLHFDNCDEGAGWSRNGRRILLCDGYVQRFVEQAAALR